MTAILGISADYHDAAAALVVDGVIVAAAQEERFTRKKHDESLPIHAIAYCLEEGGLRPDQLDYVGFYDKPLLKFDRLLETYLAVVPRGLPSFLRAMPVWLKSKLHISRRIRSALDGFRRRIVFVEHHESHAASAFYPSPFEEAAILTVDGVGEWATATLGAGRGSEIEIQAELRFPHSLGLLYSAFTSYCGFRVNSGEYKLMGLAPYGRPVYADLIRSELVDIKEDGSFRLDLRYFDFAHGLRMTSRRFHELFGGPPRRPDEELTERHADLAASIQVVTEEVVVRMARHLRHRTGLRALCMAGGVALNCVANARVLDVAGFDDLWVQPAAGDAGGALGVALFVWYRLLGHRRVPLRPDGMRAALLGPRFTPQDVRRILDGIGAVYRVPGLPQLLDDVCDLLALGKVVGWFAGRMEFGPRALGARSIVADPRHADMQSRLNRKIKFRESFRPFAPAVLAERAPEWFEISVDSPYMLLVAPLAPARRRGDPDALVNARGLGKLALERSSVPAVTHVDYSARLQTVDGRHGTFRALLERFYAKTGCPLLVNTSLNVRGEPIVCTPAEAYQCFLATDMDALVCEDVLLLKEDQRSRPALDTRSHLAQFQLD